jgi:hypothetical protein
MRAAEARITAAVVATQRGEMEHALSIGLAALNGSQEIATSLLMVAGGLDAELTRRRPAEDRIEEFAKPYECYEAVPAGLLSS